MERDHQVDITCEHCNKLYIFYVNKKDLDDFFAMTKYATDALPYLTAGERELLLSRTCNDCFDKLFGIGQ